MKRESRLFGGMLDWVVIGVALCMAVAVRAHPIKGAELADFTIYHKYVFCKLHGPAIDFVTPSGVAAEKMKGEEMEPRDKAKFLKWLQTQFWVQPDGKDSEPTLEAAFYYPNVSDNGSCEIWLKYPTQKFAKTLTITAKFDPHTIIALGGAQKTHANSPNPAIYETKANLDSLWQNLKDFAVMGMEHLFTGYDHMLFICTLIFAATGIKSVIKLLTAFTIGHAITLILSTFDVIRLNPHWVDIGVAGTIVYVALENIYRREEPPYRWALVFGFGMIHGMGFSESLREMGLPTHGLALCLLSFNIGIELAQVIIVAVVYPLLGRLRWTKERLGGAKGLEDYHRLLRLGSAFTAVMGVYWLVLRFMGK